MLPQIHAGSFREPRFFFGGRGFGQTAFALTVFGRKPFKPQCQQ
jgi:hypothetical protein